MLQIRTICLLSHLRPRAAQALCFCTVKKMCCIAYREGQGRFAENINTNIGPLYTACSVRDCCASIVTR